MSEQLISTAAEGHTNRRQAAGDILREAMQPATPEVVEEETPKVEVEEEVVQEAVEEQSQEAIESQDEPVEQTEEDSVAIETLTDLATAIEVDNEFLYNIKVPMPDGQKPVSLSELKDAYQGKLESTSATQAQLEEQRKSFEQEKADFQAQIAQQMTQVQQLPEELLSAEAQVRSIAERYQSINWEEIEQQNPGQAALDKQNLATAYAQAEAKANEIKRDLQNKQNEALRETRVKQREQLRIKLPEWENEEVRNSEYSKIAGILKDYEYEDNEITALTDPRALKMMRDYLVLKQKFDKVTNVKENVMKTPKSLKPGTPRVSDSAQKKLAERMEKARQSRNPRDKVGVISDLINSR